MFPIETAASGITILTNDEQFSKTFEPKVVTDDGISISFNVLHDANVENKSLSIESGNLTNTNDSQPLNANSPITLTEFGIKISLIDVQPEKQAAPISVTEGGIVTLDIEVQF